MKKKLFMILISVFSVFLLSACKGGMPKHLKANKITEDTLYIKADGSNQIAYISDFKEKYYNIEELKSYIFSELKDINHAFGEDTAIISDMDEANGKVKVVITFQNSKAFLEFSKKKSNHHVSFPSYSKMREEFGETAFLSASGEGQKKGSQVIDSKKDNAVRISGPILLMTERDIKYYNSGKLIDNHHIQLGNGEEALVVFER